MSDAHPAPEPLRIKKYANRRFYDVTRSRHVTLADLHDLIVAGHELTVIDARSGEDITHQVLTQILLERDAPKLAIFPAGTLHQLIRTQQQFLGGVLEQLLVQVAAAQRASSERWTRFMQNVLGAAAPPAAANPLDWTRAMFGGLRNPVAAGRSSRAAAPPDAGAAPGGGRAPDEVNELRRQVSELTRRVEKLSGRSARRTRARGRRGRGTR